MVKLSYLKIALVLWLIVGLSFNAECAKRKKLNVTVFDRETSVAIHKAQVTVITLSNGNEIETDSKNTGKDGQCKFSLKIDQAYQYKVFTSKSGYIRCVNDSGDNKIISEVLITNYDDEDLVLYLTVETKKSIAKPPEQATEPKTTETVENKIQQTDHSPVISQNETQNPIKQEIKKVEQPAAEPVSETTPRDNIEKKGNNSWVAFIVIAIIGFLIYKSKNKFTGRSVASTSSSSKPISKPKESFYCIYCGEKFSSVKLLTSMRCVRHPDEVNRGNHLLYEGGEKSQYTCKYCGDHYSSIKSMIWGLCLKHPHGTNKGHHSPAL